MHYISLSKWLSKKHLLKSAIFMLVIRRARYGERILNVSVGSWWSNLAWVVWSISTVMPVVRNTPNLYLTLHCVDARKDSCSNNV